MKTPSSPGQVLPFLLALVMPLACSWGASPGVFRGEATSSSTSLDTAAQFAMDGDRFATETEHVWKGESNQSQWVWTCAFERPQAVGSILQIHGDDPTILRNAPREYCWQSTTESGEWEAIKSTTVVDETRTARIHRFERPITTRAVRLLIIAARGEYPTLREVEFYSDPLAKIEYPPWIALVSTLDTPSLPGPINGFIPLARSCAGFELLEFQQVWLDTFQESWLAIEPRPLAAFLTGNFRDWCEVPREPWRGTQEVLRAGNLPIWAACGGAQGLGILADVGVDQPWDCPHCRDAENPRLRIYTHIGHTADKPCGDYSGCIGERGKFQVLQTARDPVFNGLPREFAIMESHVGQLAYVPDGWTLIATKGSDGLTDTQCMRVVDRPIYAAQFHLEMDGTPENSRLLLTNFLQVAKAWGGYNPMAKPLSQPEKFR